jgi:hypothetical protein
MMRDTNTKALLSNDKEKLTKYKAERDQMKKVNTLAKEVAEIKDQLSKICKLLEQTAEKR